VKSPTLRNLTLKPIFAHNGFFASLDDLLAFYNREGPTSPSVGFTTGTGPGNRLTNAEMDEVRAFFAALTDPRLVPLQPPFDRPDLYSERVPFQSNEPATHPGTPPPSSDVTPDIIVNAPALTGDAHWKIGVRDAPPDAPAILYFTLQPLLPPSAGPFYLTGPGLRQHLTSTDPDGFSTYLIPPLSLALAGATFRAQWAIFDPDLASAAYSNPGEVRVHW
jgi:hypothetical protein